MKKLFLILVLAFIFIPMLSLASPLLTCDPYPTTVVQPTEFGVVMDMGTEIYSPAKINPGDASILLEYDLSALPLGAHSVKVRACVPDPTVQPDGRSCSDYSPFDFSLGVKPPMAPRIFLKK